MKAGFHHLLLLAILLPLAVSGSARGTVLDSTQTIVAFDAANKLYEQGRFAEAVPGYQQLIDAGAGSATVYFNLGNAYYKTGQIGRSIAAYRQAERLAPREPNIQFNLNFARKRVAIGEPPARPFLDRILGALTLDEWTALAAAAVWVTFLLLALGELREASRHWARRYALITGAAILLLGAAVAGAAIQRFRPSEAVVAVPEALVRSGPLEEAKVLHHFRDGTEVRWLDQKRVADAATWFQVRNSSGQLGWVKDDQLAVLR